MYFHEVFRNWPTSADGTKIVQRIPVDAVTMLRHDMAGTFRRIYGMEVKPFHLRLVGYSAERFLKELRVLGFEKFIILDRRNRLRKVVSSVIGHQFATYRIPKGSKPEVRQAYVDVSNVQIDFASKPLVALLEEFDRDMNELEGLLENDPVLKLIYEEDVERDPRVAYQKICDFLEIPASDAQVQLGRMNPYPLRRLIINYPDVEEALRGTQYEWMLTDGDSPEPAP